LLKTLSYEKYEIYQDKFWRAGEFNMTNHQTGKKTKLIFSDYKFAVGLEDSDFSQNGLMRAGK